MAVTWDHAPNRERLLAAGVLLGIGLGGFFDGIVLHQILQWHHLVSTPTPPDTLENLQHNTFWDGIFHAATWVVTVAGVFVLMASGGARTQARGGRTLIGAMFAGWGGFNLVEGLVDHHILGLHHVKPGPDEFLYDLGFLAWGAIMLVIGTALTRRRRRGWGL
jgi:uncharacterized membrane protein